MWAVSPIPSTPWLRNTLSNTTANPPQNCLAVFSNKFRRRSPLQTTNNGGVRDDPNTQSIGGLGRAVLTALDSDISKYKSIKLPVKKKTSWISRNQRQKESGGGGGERELRGSDVLLALQRAATQRMKQKKKEDYSSSSKSNKANFKIRGGQGNEDNYTLDDNNKQARGLCLRSDWGSRLDELELRLQEFIDI